MSSKDTSHTLMIMNGTRDVLLCDYARTVHAMFYYVIMNGTRDVLLCDDTRTVHAMFYYVIRS